MPHPTDLVAATWPELEGGATLLLVPVGATEQHGLHLPLDTDTAIAEAVTRQVADRLAEQAVPAWVAPALRYGASGEHQAFPGTVSIGTAALRHQVVELVRSARTWVDRVVLVNGHGGNAPALTGAVAQLVAEGHPVRWLPCVPEEGDLHAGRTETSLMLHLRSAAVRPERAGAGDTRPLAEILPTMRTNGVAAVSANGVLGDPSGAHGAEGAVLLDAMAEEVATAVLSPDGAAVG